MGKTIISWATHTVSVVSGCSKPVEVDRETGKKFISPECVHCYAETLSLKRGWTKLPWSEPYAVENVKLKPERFKEIRRIPVLPASGLPSQRHRVFIASMGDIFHDLVPDAFLHELFEVLAATPNIYQLLTKRPERASRWPGPWPEHIWLGTTCGSKRTKHRIDYLKESRAQVRFISAEPLLDSMVPLDLSGIHQVIVGGESGSGYRRMDHSWARQIRNECVRQQCAFFFKQSAAYRTEMDCWLLEEDGTAWEWRQFPGELTPPVQVFPPASRIEAQHVSTAKLDRMLRILAG